MREALIARTQKNESNCVQWSVHTTNSFTGIPHNYSDSETDSNGKDIDQAVEAAYEFALPELVPEEEGDDSGEEADDGTPVPVLDVLDADPRYMHTPKMMFYITGLKMDIFGIGDNSARMQHMYMLVEGLWPAAGAGATGPDEAL